MAAINKKEHEERLYWYNKGLNDQEIANKVDRIKKTIYNWRKANGLKPNGKKWKLKEDKIKEIYKKIDNKNTVNMNQIARDIGCSVGSVYYWFNKLQNNCQAVKN